MKGYHHQGDCEVCQEYEVEILVDGHWLCYECGMELGADGPIFSGLEYAQIKWGEARIIQGGQS